MKGAKGLFSAAAAVAVGAALFYFAFRDVHLSEVLGRLQEFRPAWAPLLLAMPVLDLYIRAARWKILLSGAGSVRVLFQLEAVGLALNNVLFLRLGELARGVIGARELGLSTIGVLATIVVERLLDMAALLAIFAVGSASLGMDPSLRLWAVAGAAGIAAGLAAVTLGGERFRRSKAFARLQAKPRLARLADDLIRGSEGLRAPRAAAMAAAYSFALWLADAALYWATARSMAFEPSLGYGQSVVTLTAAAAASALPAVPGAWGNFEAAVKEILVQLGYGKSLALSYAAFVHLIMYCVVTGLGLIFFYRLGHTFSGLRKALSERA